MLAGGVDRFYPSGHDALLKVQLDGRSRLLAVGGNHGPNIDIPNPTELYLP